jgi:hypothetical protein
VREIINFMCNYMLWSCLSHAAPCECSGAWPGCGLRESFVETAECSHRNNHARAVTHGDIYIDIIVYYGIDRIVACKMAKHWELW